MLKTMETEIEPRLVYSWSSNEDKCIPASASSMDYEFGSMSVRHAPLRGRWIVTEVENAPDVAYKSVALRIDTASDETSLTLVCYVFRIVIVKVTLNDQGQVVERVSLSDDKVQPPSFLYPTNSFMQDFLHSIASVKLSEDGSELILEDEGSCVLRFRRNQGKYEPLTNLDLSDSMKGLVQIGCRTIDAMSS